MTDAHGPFINDPVPNLLEAVQKFEQWHYSNMPGAKQQALSWAQAVHFWSTMALAEAQDEAEGEKEGLLYTDI